MGFWTPMQESISSFGQMINAPVIFDWNTQAARNDAASGATWNTTSGVKRPLNSVAAQESGIADVWGREAVKQQQGGQVYQPYAQISEIAGGGFDQNGNYIQAAAGGGGGGAVSSAQMAADQARKNAQTSQEAYRLGGVQSATDTANKYSTDVNSFLDTVQDSQSTINTGRTNNALNTRRSMSSIAGGIRQGLRSGGVQLANMNATDSGASDAMARAYAEMGTQQSNDVNNEAALKENELMSQQAVLDDRKTRKLTEFDAAREADIARIRGDMQSKLMQLDAEASAAGANGAVDMGLVDQIVAEAQQRLGAVDSIRGQRLGGIKTLSADDVSRQAAEMDAAGTVGTSPFAAPAALGMQQQGNGAPISQLPFYTRRDDQQTIGRAPLTDEEKQRL